MLSLCKHLKWSAKLRKCFYHFPAAKFPLFKQGNEDLDLREMTPWGSVIFSTCSLCHPQSVWAEASLTSEL